MSQLAGQQNARGMRKLFSVSDLHAIFLFPLLFFHEASSVREYFPSGFNILFVWERWGKCHVMDSSSGFCSCSCGLIHLDVSSSSYCSLDTRGSQKVWYKAFNLLQCHAQRTRFPRKSTMTVPCFCFSLSCSVVLQAEWCDLALHFALPFGMVPSFSVL